MTRHAVAARPSGAGARVLVVAGLLASILSPGPARAASPAPSFPIRSDIEVWLDEPLTPDAPAGGLLSVGFTLWDARASDFSQMNDPYVRLHPKTGRAKPSMAVAHSDWPGHLVAEVAVPKGGVGVLEVGVSGDTVCTPDGTCAVMDTPFATGGVGPPPHASIASLVEATVHPPAGPLVSGEPIEVIVDLAFRVSWDPATISLPDRLIAIVSPFRSTGQDVANSELRQGTPGSGSYTGAVLPTEPGEFTMTIAIPQNGSEDVVIPHTATRLSVTGDGSGDVRATAGAPAPGAPVTAGSGDSAIGLIPWIAAGLVGLLIAGLVIRRAFADL